MDQSLLSRQNAMVSSIEARLPSRFRRSRSSRSQSSSLSLLPPAMPRLSRSRFCRSCVAFSSRRHLSFSCIISSGDIPSYKFATTRGGTPAAGGGSSGSDWSFTSAAPPVPDLPEAPPDSEAFGPSSAASLPEIGPVEKLVLRLFFWASRATSQCGGRHQGPSSHRRKDCVRQAL